MLGSRSVVRALARRGVKTVFSLSGNQIMPLYDACIDAGIRIVHVRHEAAAVFMADAWSQVTGEVGVALLTAGPGIANGVGALYSALLAESPVLLLSGDSPLAEDGRGAFQELDQVAMTAPVTRRSYRVTAADALARSVDEAFALAQGAAGGQGGPVHLALPFDLLGCDAGSEELPPLPPAAPVPAPDAAVLAQAGELLATAQRPIVLTGPTGCRAANRARWQAVGERLGVPVVPMESPRGLRDPSLGTVARELARADLVLLAGKRVDFSLGFGKGGAVHADAKVLHIDTDPAGFFDALASGLAGVAADRPARDGWRRAVAAAVAGRALHMPPAAASGIDPRTLCEAVQRLIDTVPNPILVCDGGEFGQWAQAFCSAPVRIVNGMSGAIGGGLCYAVAARIARPDATVIALMGDGSSGFHFMEFDTAVRENAPFVAVIGNDRRWNAEHMIQLRGYGPDRLVGCELGENARYHATAAALGGFGVAVDAADALVQALGDAVRSGLAACVDVRLDSMAAPVFIPPAFEED